MFKKKPSNVVLEYDTTKTARSKSSSGLLGVRADPSANPSLESDIEHAQSKDNVKALMYLRSSPRFELNKELVQIGSRDKEKFFYLVNDKQTSNLDVMTVVSKNPASSIRLEVQTTTEAFVELFARLSHPYIFPTVAADVLSDGSMAVIIRGWTKEGSLKDLMHSASPQAKYAKKYKTAPPLGERKIARYGRQILEGLNFLQQKNIPYPHLHLGNILLSNGVCRLSDFENGLLSIRPKLHDKIVAVLSKNIKLEPEVICFGHVIYEMATGFELDEPFPSFVPASVPPAVKAVLDMIFFPANPEQGITIEELMRVPLFGTVDTVEIVDPKSVKLQSEMKMLIKRARLVTGLIMPDPSLAPSSVSVSASSSAVASTDDLVNKAGSRKSVKIKRSSTVSGLTASSGGALVPSPSPPASPKPPASTSFSSPPPPAPAAPSTLAPPPPPPAPSAPRAPAPPPPAPPAAPSAPRPPSAPPAPAPSADAPPERGALLNSIQGFNKNGLKKSQTVEKGVIKGGKVVG